MKKFLMIISAVSVLAGCSQTPSSNTNSAAQTSNNPSVISSHSTGNNSAPTVPNSNGAKSSPSGNSPMAKAIDVSKMTADIEKADKALKAKPNDVKAKEDLAKAYFVRAFALTDAAQYRAALGDFRKGLKLNPNDADAKAMHDKIIAIFQNIGREPPKEGEEPPPMPFEKENAKS